MRSRRKWYLDKKQGQVGIAMGIFEVAYSGVKDEISNFLTGVVIIFFVNTDSGEGPYWLGDLGNLRDIDNL